MEESLGVALLIRDRRGVQPTSAGRALLHHARAVLQQMDRMHGELDQYGKGLKGHVRLLCNTSALSEYLPDILSDFLTQHRSEEHTSELQSLMRISYAVFCLKKKNKKTKTELRATDTNT